MRKYFTVFISIIIICVLNIAHADADKPSLRGYKAAASRGGLRLSVSSGSFTFSSINIENEMDKYKNLTTDQGNKYIITYLSISPYIWVLNPFGNGGVNKWRLYLRCSDFTSIGYNISAENIKFSTSGGEIKPFFSYGNMPTVTNINNGRMSRNLEVANSGIGKAGRGWYYYYIKNKKSMYLQFPIETVSGNYRATITITLSSMP